MRSMPLCEHESERERMGSRDKMCQVVQVTSSRKKVGNRLVEKPPG